MMGLASVFSFGKYRGLSVAAVVRFDPGYLGWLRRNVPNVDFDAEALAAIRPALREEREQSMQRQNAWCWGFGREARASAGQRSRRAIRIEHEERRKAGQEPCPKCFPSAWRACQSCRGAGWITASAMSAGTAETAQQAQGQRPASATGEAGDAQ